jgi:hypothetical protein
MSVRETMQSLLLREYSTGKDLFFPRNYCTCSPKSTTQVRVKFSPKSTVQVRVRVQHKYHNKSWQSKNCHVFKNASFHK